MLDTKVPKGNKNCWTCPNCDQYNGFKSDGDYNMPIPSQFDENMNYGIGAIKNKECYQNSDVYFCNLCLEKQTRKMELLNKFTPKNERYSEQEFLIYKTSLEQQFNLCFTCQSRVNDKINLKNNEILPDYIEWSTKQKRKRMIKEKRKYSLIKQLNILPVFMITSCFLSQIIVYSSPFLNIESLILDILVEHQNKLNILNFLIVFISAKFGSLRPSIAFPNLQLLLIILITLYNYMIDIENITTNRLMKLPILLTLICLFLRFIWRFIMLIKALSYSKYSLALITSPEKENPISRFIENKDSIDNYSEYSRKFPKSTINYSCNQINSPKSKRYNRLQSEIHTNIESNMKFPTQNINSKKSISLKPSKLNYVKAPQTSLLFDSKSILSLRDFGNSKNGTSICSRSPSDWNFDSISQCLSGKSSSNHSKCPSVHSPTSFISASSRLSHQKPKEISFSYWKVLLKYFFGAILGIGLNLILFLLLSHLNVNIENYLYLK